MRIKESSTYLCYLINKLLKEGVYLQQKIIPKMNDFDPLFQEVSNLSFYEFESKFVNFVDEYIIDFRHRYKAIKIKLSPDFKNEYKGEVNLNYTLSDLYQKLNSILQILTEYYDQLSQISPFIYFDEEFGTINYYNKVVELQIPSKEYTITAFLFKEKIGTKFNIGETADQIFSTKTEDNDFEDQDPGYDHKKFVAQVRTAKNGINEKTRKTFGFSIIKVETPYIHLHFPQ